MDIKIGDFVKGITNDYGITNTKMTRGVVINVYERNIEVRVLDHDDGETGVYTVDPKKFEVIGHQKQFDHAEVLKLLKDGCKKAILDYDLSYADLRGANLSDADLSDADLRGANLDYSCYPRWCGSLHLKADKRLACQLAYQLCSMQCDDADYIKMRNSILGFANQFHRADECGELKEREI